jgi:DNA-binding transcriptional regulator GbsR (MarR family)
MSTTETEKRQFAKKLFAEDVGILFEIFNLPRMAGRILGHLLVCHPPHQTAAELMAATGGSKGSISTMIQLLIHSGLVERLGIPGKRETYYIVKAGSWIELIKNRLGFLKAMRELAARGLAMMEDDDGLQCQRLEEIYDLYAFLENEVPMVFERYKQAMKFSDLSRMKKTF